MLFRSCFDTRTLIITSRGFYAVFGHTPNGVRNFISYPLGAGGHGGHSTLTVYVGLEHMFYDITDHVFLLLWFPLVTQFVCDLDHHSNEIPFIW